MSIKELRELGKLMSNYSTDADVPVTDKNHVSEPESVPDDGKLTVNLKRNVKVYCWRVHGLVAKETGRDELISVLKRAHENNKTNAKDIANHLFFDDGSRVIVAQRLLDLAVRYRLLEQGDDKEYVLADGGFKALESRKVFIPDEGDWTIWASDDAMLDTPILRIEQWNEPSAYDELRGENKNQSRTENFKQLPGWLMGAVGTAVTPVSGAQTLMVQELDPKGEMVDPQASLTVFWNVLDDRVRVRGEILDHKIDSSMDTPKEPFEVVWKQLLQANDLWQHWDEDVHALRVGFDDVHAEQRESMSREITFTAPVIDGLGEFDKTRVQKVALRPRTQCDANSWAEWRLKNRLCDYATNERFEQWTTEAREPFEEFNPTIPSRERLAEKAKLEWSGRPTPGAWYLVAAEDWSL